MVLIVITITRLPVAQSVQLRSVPHCTLALHSGKQCYKIHPLREVLYQTTPAVFVIQSKTCLWHITLKAEAFIRKTQDSIANYEDHKLKWVHLCCQMVSRSAVEWWPSLMGRNCGYCWARWVRAAASWDTWPDPFNMLALGSAGEEANYRTGWLDRRCDASIQGHCL